MRLFHAFLLVVVLSTVSLAQTELKGIEVGDMDRSVDPCNDFYEYSNGTWRKANPMPPSMQRWSRRWAAGELAKDQLRTANRRLLRRLHERVEDQQPWHRSD